jgi:hypothetical protein
MIAISLVFVQCKQKKIQDISLSDSTKFFPVSNFIQEDINDVLQTPYLIYKTTEYRPGRKDSSILNREGFESIATEFLKKNITTQELKPYYRETVFHDLSTKSFTITYSTLNHELEVQNILILLNDSTNKLKRIFILCSSTQGDSSIVSQYNWKAGMSFQINRLIKRKDGSSYEELNTVVWNDKLKN